MVAAQPSQPSQASEPPPSSSPAEPGPLAGIRVVSIAVNVPGPWVAARLVALGAAVTKVEPPAGDPLELMAPGWYAQLAAGQDRVRIDLKDSDGWTRLDTLLSTADLFVTSHRPSALGRLALAYQQVHERHPRLVYLAIVGHAGAGAEIAGHDLTYQAHAGILRPPGLPSVLISDLAGAERATAAALAGVIGRDRTGMGGYLEVALADAAEAFAAPLRSGLTAPGALLGGGLPAYGLYATADGWIALAALEPHFTERADAALQDLDPGHRRGLIGDRRELANIFAQRTTADWEGWAADRDIPLVALRPPDETGATGP